MQVSGFLLKFRRLYYSRLGFGWAMLGSTVSRLFGLGWHYIESVGYVEGLEVVLTSTKPLKPCSLDSEGDTVFGAG